MELIIIIAIIFFVIKSNKVAEQKVKKNNQNQDQWQQLAMNTLMKEQTQAQNKAQEEARRAEIQSLQNRLRRKNK